MITPQIPVGAAGARPSVLLSVLELGATDRKQPAEEVVQQVVDIAQVSEECGFHRFWLAEHHASPDVLSSAPVVLIAHVAARTRHIRVGSGGVMLPNHAPYVVAEQFATLGALHPGRIDLGVGRSPSSAGTADHRRLLDAALRRDPRVTIEFPALIDELVGFMDPAVRAPEPFRSESPALLLSPRVDAPAEVYVLGAGESAARTAAERSLPFVYGHHLGRSKCRPAAVERYRATFVSGPHDARPYVMASLNVLCAANDDEAERLALHAASHAVRHRTGTTPDESPAPVREEFLARRFLEDQQVVHGGRVKVIEGIERIVGVLDVDEIVLVPFDLTGTGRIRTLRMLAGRQAHAPAAVAALRSTGAIRAEDGSRVHTPERGPRR
ncbi:MsnO8 family LLM class oxidoreductase [Streptomyces sp. NPDC050535]|uniref:MsnO8 family LLM class oxidoreductase n=1 Tax=Streptomyces sp. NPDC050535 TaxID=3365626 RepID=UPI00379AAF38